MNERLNKIKTDSKSFWTSRTKKQKGVMIGGIILIIALASVITYFSTRTKMVPVFTDLSVSEVGQIKEVLDAQGTPYELAAGGANILVPESQVDAVTVSLVSQGYPNSGGITSSFFAENAGFGTTENEFNILKNAAAETELANLLKQIDGVKDASVKISVPEQSVFISDSEETTSAAVLLKTNPGQKFSSDQVLTLYNLVSKSVPNLPLENITISNQYSEYYDLNAAASSSNGSSTNTVEGQMAIKKDIERDLQRQVQSMLGTIVGQDKVAVTVTTSIDFKQENREESLVEPVDEENMTGIAISAQSISETYTGTNAASGVPEAETPTDNLVDYVEGSNANGDYERIEETVNNEVNRIKKQIQESPYKVKNIGIQVTIEPPAENDEDEVRGNVEKMLAAIVRTSLDSETASTLTEEQIANNIVVAVQPLYSSTNTVDDVQMTIPWWLWVIGGILVAAIILLIVFILRSKKSKELANEEFMIEEQQELLIKDISEEKETESTIRRKQLEKMAKEKPDDFAKLLRTWIAEE